MPPSAHRSISARHPRAAALRALICGLLIMALSALGLGHQQMMSPQDQAQANAYILAGGSFADLCGSNGTPANASANSCMACMISAGCDLPPSTGLPMQADIRATVRWPDASLAVLTTAYRHRRGARAPPLA